MNRTGRIYGINGPIITIKGNPGFKMAEMVYVGKQRLVGEVIGLRKRETVIQVFVRIPGANVTLTGAPIPSIISPGRSPVVSSNT